ncbi:MAG: hypothetical protein IJT60_02065 [Clostridia bacterium]|nr:hypothetical protein [Clostridia bacterium]
MTLKAGLRLLSLLMCFCMLICVFASCGQSAEPDKSSETQGDQTKETTESESEKGQEAETDWYEPTGHSGKPYEGKTFGVLAFTNDTSYYWHDTDFLIAGDITGDILTDAVFQRYNYVVEHTGVDIEIENEVSMDQNTTFVSAILDGKDQYHLVNLSTQKMFNMATRGYLVNVLNLDTLQLSAPWWDQNAKEQLTIGNKLFGLYGDLGIMARKTLGIISFNKQELKNRAPDVDIYEVQNNKQWTIDYFAELAERIADDLDGDQVMTDNDLFGVVYQGDAMPVAFICAGIRFVGKDENDLPYLNFNNERTIDCIEMLASLLYDTDVARSSSAQAPKIENHSATFRSEHAVFDIGEFHSVINNRVLEWDFGVVCYPMFDELQSNYMTCINPHVASTGTVPNTITDYDFVAYMLDELAAAGKNYLNGAFYDIVLTSRAVRDEQSKATLDLVSEHVIYDLGYLSSWGISELMRGLVNSRSKDFVSKYGSEEPRIEAKIKDTVDAIKILVD